MKLFSLSKKIQEFLFVFTIILILIMINVGSLMYLPALSSMSEYFNVGVADVSFISRSDFRGLALGCLFAGGLANSYGKRKMMLCSLLLFSIGSVVAAFSHNFFLVVLACFLMGVTKAVPSVLCISMILSRYKEVKANNMMLVTRIFDSISLIVIPMLAVWVLNNFGWRGEFITVAMASMVAFMCAFLFIKDEKKDKDKMVKFSIISVLKGHKKLLMNIDYISNVMVYVIPSALITLFMNSASLVMVGMGEISVDHYGYYGSILVTVYIVFCFISIYVSNKKGIDYCKNIGVALVIIGVIFMVISRLDITTYKGSSYSFGFDQWVIFISIYICSAGSAMMNGFFIRATMVFPEMSAAAVSLLIVVSSLVSVRSIYWANVLYDSSMKPSITIIMILSLFMLGGVTLLSMHSKKNKKQKSVEN